MSAIEELVAKVELAKTYVRPHGSVSKKGRPESVEGHWRTVSGGQTKLNLNPLFEGVAATFANLSDRDRAQFWKDALNPDHDLGARYMRLTGAAKKKGILIG